VDELACECHGKSDRPSQSFRDCDHDKHVEKRKRNLETLLTFPAGCLVTVRNWLSGEVTTWTLSSKTKSVHGLTAKPPIRGGR